MIDEAVLEELLAQAADEIPVPLGGPEAVLTALAVVSGPSHRSRPRFTKPLIAAAATILIALLAVPMLHTSSSAKHLAVSAPTGLNDNTRSRHGPIGKTLAGAGANRIPARLRQQCRIAQIAPVHQFRLAVHSSALSVTFREN